MSNHSFDTSYMYPNHWTKELIEYNKNDLEAMPEPYIREVNNAVLLPTRKEKGKTWGLGGVIDANNVFVKESGVHQLVYGGGYDVDRKSCEYIEEPIVFIPIIPMHWGHFLIDTICRLWCFLDDTANYRQFDIYYNKRLEDQEEIQENFLQMLKLLNIDVDRLHLIKQPICCKKVFIPSATFSYEYGYHRKYREIIDRIVTNAFSSMDIDNLTPIEKVYFTRTKFKGARRTDVGEKKIEEYFHLNGFTVLAPEELSTIEQIYYIHSCKVMASMSGTVAHNVIFAGRNVKQIILNRSCAINPPQVNINHLFQINCTYVDIYDKYIESHPNNYGIGTVWVGITDHLKRYMSDNGYHVKPKWVKLCRNIDVLRFIALNSGKKIKAFARTHKSFICISI